MTVYVKRNTDDADIEKLHSAITAISGVQNAVVLMPMQARENFARDLGSYSDIGASLPESAFSPSIDIFLTSDLSNDKTARHALATRLSKVHMIEEVEVYDDWFDRLSAVSTMGRTAAWGLGILAAVVAILVVTATVRTGVSARRREISVLRYVGATETYVRAPFLIEGAVEASLAMGLAIVSLDLLMNHVDTVVGSILPLLGGGQILRLECSWLAAMMIGSLLAGLIGARLSLRRLEET
jgi:cell division transport system permease protein